MKKVKCFIAIGHLRFGGIQKSLLTFLDYILPNAEVDLLVWDNVGELKVPNRVNVLKYATVKSVKYSIKKHGLFSKETFYALKGCIAKKRWSVLPSIKKEYDVAISYTNGGYGKYFVIDKVNAKKKYTFFHNGAYLESDKWKSWDKEYYPKYDKVFAVSQHIKEMLINELGDSGNFDVFPNLINIKSIELQAKEPCQQIDDYGGVKILTIGRLSPEKNPLIIPKIVQELINIGLDFKWFIVGDGEVKTQLQQIINESKLEKYVMLCGSQLNPYKFMSRCDIYAQFSKYEADPITLKEVSVFNKNMVLSDIQAYKNCQGYLENLNLCLDDPKCIAEKIKATIQVNTKVNSNLEIINETPIKKIKEIFGI